MSIFGKITPLRTQRQINSSHHLTPIIRRQEQRFVGTITSLGVGVPEDTPYRPGAVRAVLRLIEKR